MNPSRIKHEYCGKTFDITYSFYPEVPQTHDYPGDGERIEIETIFLGKENMSDFFFEANLFDNLEKSLYDTLCEMAQKEQDHHYER